MGTGSRRLIVLPEDERLEICNRTQEKILEYYEQYPDLVIISGMAEGWDELLAIIAINNGIPFDAYVPNETYGKYYWEKHSLTGKNRYKQFEKILSKARNINYSSKNLYSKLNNKSIHSNILRNQHMVDVCDEALVFALDKDNKVCQVPTTGTADALKRLKDSSKKYIIYPF